MCSGGIEVYKDGGECIRLTRKPGEKLETGKVRTCDDVRRSLSRLVAPGQRLFHGLLAKFRRHISLSTQVDLIPCWISRITQGDWFELQAVVNVALTPCRADFESELLW